MRKLLDKYSILEERLLVASLALNVLIVFVQIVMRSIFNHSISWSEELSRYIFIWQIWLGASVACHYNEHLKVDLIYSVFQSPTAHKCIRIFVDVVWLAFNIFLTYQGMKLLQSMNARHALSSGMRLPLVYIYASLPISALVICIRILLDIVDELTDKKTTDQKLEG